MVAAEAELARIRARLERERAERAPAEQAAAEQEPDPLDLFVGDASEFDTLEPEFAPEFAPKPEPEPKPKPAPAVATEYNTLLGLLIDAGPAGLAVEEVLRELGAITPRPFNAITNLRIDGLVELTVDQCLRYIPRREPHDDPAPEPASSDSRPLIFVT